MFITKKHIMGYYLPQKSYLKPKMRTAMRNRIMFLTAGISFIGAMIIFAMLHFEDNSAYANVSPAKPGGVKTSETEKNIPVIQNTGNINFPAMLAFFIVTPNECSVDLKWATVSEYKNKFFTIEKSFNKSDFKEIARIDANGTTKKSNDYEFTDPAPPTQLAFYRLKQVSTTGESSFVALEKVEANDQKRDSELFIENIGPEPFEKSFNINYYSEFDGGVSVELLDKEGHRIYKAYTKANKGYNTCRFMNGEYLEDDVYILRISNSNAVYVKKIKKKV
jgi:hypothetical protein